MRVGELIGLKYNDVNFENVILNIKLEYNYVTKTFTEPKGYKLGK